MTTRDFPTSTTEDGQSREVIEKSLALTNKLFRTAKPEFGSTMRVRTPG